MPDVALAKCTDYSPAAVKDALRCVIEAVEGFSFLRPGMCVGVKANLVSAMRPDTAATTHPEVLVALTELLKEKGASVVIGDSPGGLYNLAFVSRVYALAGLKACEAAGAELNHDFSQTAVDFPEGKVLKHFQYTAWLDKCDAVIDVCKLKTHGMMNMSAAAKNLFGVIPGTLKPEYHYRFPNHRDFADMLIDLNDFVKPVLSICDAVVGMEGNGPTAGSPRPIGAILAGKSPHALDLACAPLIGLDPADVPTLVSAMERGYIPASAGELDIEGPYAECAVKDFKPAIEKAVSFEELLPGKVGRIFGKVVKKALQSRPSLNKKDCIGCGQCKNICQPHAITMKNKLPSINRKLCIRCFCCQEFCPKGALVVRRTPIARLLVRTK